MKKIIVLIVLISFSLLLSAQNRILIKNGTIMPVEGDEIKKGDILIENGKIKQIGRGIHISTDIKTIDARNMYVFPGFIDGYSHYGLTEISAFASTLDTSELGRENPELKVTWAINPHSVHINTGRLTGTTTALVAPTSGLFPGISAIIKLDGWTIDEMLVKEEATSFINFPMTPRRSRSSRMGTQEKSKIDITTKIVGKIKDYLKEARHYLKLKELAKRNKAIKSPDVNQKYEALIPVLQKKLPVIISVEKAKDIKHAIKFALEEKINVIFRGCTQGYMVADRIKNAKIPVIIDYLYSREPIEPEEGYDAAFRNVVELSKAGVLFCFSTGYNTAGGKDLTYHAGRAVAYGLDKKAAIEALTINAAKIFGIDKRLGSLKVGKDADLFIVDKDPLDIRSEVKYMIISGKIVDLADNWWTKLYNKWSNRPIE